MDRPPALSSTCSPATPFVKTTKPDAIVAAAVKVKANSTYPVEFLTENATAVEPDGPHTRPTSKLLFLGSRASTQVRGATHPRTVCSPGRWSRPATLMRSPRSRASVWPMDTAANTAMSGSRRCPPTSTGGRQLRPGNSRAADSSTASMRRNGAPSVTLWGDSSALREFSLGRPRQAVMFTRHDPDRSTSGKRRSRSRLATVIAEIVGFRGGSSGTPQGTPARSSIRAGCGRSAGPRRCTCTTASGAATRRSSRVAGRVRAMQAVARTSWGEAFR